MSQEAKTDLKRQMSADPLQGDPHDTVSPGVGNYSLMNQDLENEKDKQRVLEAQNQFLLDVLGSDDYVPTEANRYVKDMVDLKDNKQPDPSAIQKKYSIQERIEQVQNGSYIAHCISAPSQDLNKGVEEFQTKDDQYEFNITNNYKKLEDGSLEMTNKWLLKKQKQVLGYIVKQFGSALVSGKSVMNVSLPITIFEPKSLLERLADSFVFAPHFLERAGQIDDTLEQFKLALTFYLTTLAADLNPEKPFNPILGETFQGVIGGCPVYLEQISHHPPIAAFQMIGKNFKIQGSFEFFASISANSVKARRIGDFKLIFKNTGAVIEVQFPIGVMSGTSFGKRAWQFTKKMHVYDLGNNYYAEIDFEKSESSKKRKEMPGYFANHIYKITDKFVTKIKQDSQKSKDFELKFKEKEHATEKLDMFEGSWLEGLSIGNQPYWTNTVRPYKLEYFDHPLPSDCNFRLDLLYLKAGDEIKAQDAKVSLEESQRKDKKLKEHSKTKNLK